MLNTKYGKVKTYSIIIFFTVLLLAASIIFTKYSPLFNDDKSYVITLLLTFNSVLLNTICPKVLTTVKFKSVVFGTLTAKLNCPVLGFGDTEMLFDNVVFST